MDDIGLRLAERDDPSSQRLGRLLIDGMPKVLAVLSVVGTIAMLWVGGHILIAGAHELGWHWPHDVVHHARDWVVGVPAVGGALAWMIDTLISAIVGLVIGNIVLEVVNRIRRSRSGGHDGAAAPAH
jgi:predicted DNA repair protein MutK